MFTTESEKHDFAVKPMNCPGHILIFNSGLRSYRDLPLRYGEFGACHRNEPSGALHGIMRVRGFTQDDGHIFCTDDADRGGVRGVQQAGARVYATSASPTSRSRSRCGPVRGSAATTQWDARRGGAARRACANAASEWTELPGEGAFYGPKIEYHLKDSIGRSWQCGTMQVDFQMPGRLGAEYVAADDTRQVPVMLHRAIVGSLERFIGMLIEHYAGALPLWLSPQQVVVLTITDRAAAYAESVVAALKAAGFRASADLRNEKITYKIREHSLQKLPYQLILGDKEQQAGTVAVRTRGGEDLGAMPLDALLERLRKEVAARQ